MHAKNAGKARLACSTIKPVTSLYVEKTLQYVEGAQFSRYVESSICGHIMSTIPLALSHQK